VRSTFASQRADRKSDRRAVRLSQLPFLVVGGLVITSWIQDAEFLDRLAERVRAATSRLYDPTGPSRSYLERR
jgi:hypothetical protein